MKKYEFALQHDNGELIIQTRARNITIAMEIICKAENCPQSAIKWWRVIPTAKQIKKTQNLMRGI
jgi:hypothetical protein